MNSGKNMLEEQKISAQNLGHKIEDFYDQPVPIYKLKKKGLSFKACLPPPINHENQKSIKPKEGAHPELFYFAKGNLVGQFYNIGLPVTLDNIMFIGNFKGILQKSEVNNDQQLYFEGTISKFIVLLNRSDRGGLSDNPKLKDIMDELQQTETSFKGFFKGSFHEWNKIKGLKDIELVMQKWVEIEKNISNQRINSNCNNLIWHQFYPLKDIQQEKQQDLKSLKKEIRKQDKTPWQYFLPTVVRFQVEQIRSINLEKSGAVVSGNFFIEVQYNDQIKHLVQVTKRKIKEKEAIVKKILNQSKSPKQVNEAKQKAESYHNFLKIELGFHRDFNLTLSLEQEDDEANESQGSEWSIMDKTWDITFEDDVVNRIFKWRIWKCFDTEIDNSFGAFFAPFNLSNLRIVMTLHHLVLQNQNDKKVKVNLIGIDVMDYDASKGYDPFLPLQKLEEHKQFEKYTYIPQYNRFHKINRLNCRDNNVYKIADNRLTLYPYYRSVLINKNTANETYEWSMGLQEKKNLLNEPEVRSVSEGYNHFRQILRNRNDETYMKIQTFQMQKWNYVIVEVPIYKYVVIDMIQVFVPLILLAAISLLIFRIDNGIGNNNGGYTNLVFRILNAASLMIAYVSLIPIIRESLPPMPGITLVQILAYILTAPIFLALISSMLSYGQSIDQWRLTYQTFQDAVFIIAFVICITSFVVMIILFIGYMLKDYKIKNGVPRPRDKRYKYRSPQYMKFMEQTKLKRNQCIIEVENIQINNKN